MAITAKINTKIGVIAEYHTIFWYQGIASKENDKIKAIIRSYISKESYEADSQHLEQTELSFELPKDFNGQLRAEIYNRAKALEKFDCAEDDI